MIEDDVADALTAYLNASKAAFAATLPAISGWTITAYESDDPIDPPNIVVQVTGARARVRGTNLYDVDVAVKVTAKIGDDSGLKAEFTAVWKWVQSLLYSGAYAVSAINASSADTLHCYTLQGTPADSSSNNDESGTRERTSTLTGCFISKASA